MIPKVLIFIGPPGSGKDTQGLYFARTFGFYQFQSAIAIKKRLMMLSPDDPDRLEAERRYTRGELWTPELVARLVMDELRDLIAEKGKIGFVFSGSFRTLIEAEIEIPFFEEQYGKENIHIFFLDISKEESIKRNSGRRICQANGHPLPDLPKYQDIIECEFDGSAFIKKDLDLDVKIITHRYDIYQKDTAPVLTYLKERGYEVIKIAGENSIHDIRETILKHIKSYPS